MESKNTKGQQELNCDWSTGEIWEINYSSFREFSRDSDVSPRFGSKFGFSRRQVIRTTSSPSSHAFAANPGNPQIRHILVRQWLRIDYQEKERPIENKRQLDERMTLYLAEKINPYLREKMIKNKTKHWRENSNKVRFIEDKTTYRERERERGRPLWKMKQLGSSNHLIWSSSLAYRGRTPNFATLVGSNVNINFPSFTIPWKC